jgi:hypothetical protein
MHEAGGGENMKKFGKPVKILRDDVDVWARLAPRTSARAPIVSMMRFTQSIMTGFRGGSNCES